jgi:antibiotic biosynthesis monooxygenase (ABM) superfamily enzyme
LARGGGFSAAEISGEWTVWKPTLLDLMIARIWHGWTKPPDAKTYENMLRDEILPGIARRNIPGYRGAELFIREDGDEVQFVTVLRFDSMETVKEFAGADESRPVIYPKAEPLLTRMDERSQHYRIVPLD